jgi:hypothetical protein
MEIKILFLMLFMNLDISLKDELTHGKDQQHHPGGGSEEDGDKPRFDNGRSSLGIYGPNKDISILVRKKKMKEE